MSHVEVAERKARLRAIFFFALAGAILLLLIVAPRDGTGRGAAMQGLWGGLTLGALINLSPIARWLKPNRQVARLLDDEGTREHRRMSCTAGFWAAMAAAMAIAMLMTVGSPLGAAQAAQLIATAAVVAALIGFATLELRAAL